MTITREGILGVILGAALAIIYLYPAPGTVLHMNKRGELSQRAVFNNQVDCRIIRGHLNKADKPVNITWHCKGWLWSGNKT